VRQAQHCSGNLTQEDLRKTGLGRDEYELPNEAVIHSALLGKFTGRQITADKIWDASIKHQGIADEEVKKEESSNLREYQAWKEAIIEHDYKDSDHPSHKSGIAPPLTQSSKFGGRRRTPMLGLASDVSQDVAMLHQVRPCGGSSGCGGDGGVGGGGGGGGGGSSSSSSKECQR